MDSEPQHVIVTGGAGFLGSHLCRRLLADGHRVLCVDNFLTGRQENIADLLKNPRFELLEHDIINPLPDTGRPTQIYNLACAASPPRYQADPIHTLRTCVQGAYNVLELARTSGARALQASTSEVYGNPRVHPQSENYHGDVNPVGLRSCYDEGKRCAETLFSDFSRCKGVHTKIARIFNTYGPGMAPDDGRVVSTFIVQALRGKPLTVYGDGTHTRSLCYVDDLITGLILLMNSVETFRGPVNLGNPDELSVGQIAERVLSLTGSASEIVHHPLPPDDPAQRCPDILLARRHLNWQPIVPTDEGLRQTIQYFSEQYPSHGSERAKSRPAP